MSVPKANPTRSGRDCHPDIQRAEVDLDEREAERPYLLLILTPEAGERFYELTKEWLGRRLAIVVNGHVESAPSFASRFAEAAWR